MMNKNAKFVGKVLHNGKVTIPAHVRTLLKLKKGDYVQMTITNTFKERNPPAKGMKDQEFKIEVQ